DATPEARQAIKEGKIYADVIQKPRDIGRKTIEAISLYASGQSVEPQILIPCGLFTHEEALAER
ncbi:MAG TPA: sugar ABC transporter substrate-binding protein, partial [bacterium]